MRPNHTHSTKHTKTVWPAKIPMTIGMIALGVLVGVLGVWSVKARIAGAVIAAGVVQVQNNNQVIQHPEGGVVGKILAKNGDTVNAGDVVLQLDGTFLNFQLRVGEAQLREIQARIARLIAERDGANDLVISDELADVAAQDESVKDLVDGQRRLLIARRESLQKERDYIAEQIVQVHQEIKGTQAQLAAFGQQKQLIDDELINHQHYLKNGLVTNLRLHELKQEQVEIKGNMGKFQAIIAQLRGQIVALEIQSLNITISYREEAITALRDLQYREMELLEEQGAIREQLSRMKIRSPVDGVIYNSSIFASKAVVSPATPIMYVIPQDESLIIAAEVESIHIDQLHIGQSVSLNFSALDQRFAPEISGRVINLSADSFLNETTGLLFYKVQIAPNDEEIKQLGQQTLLPGMPVEAFIKTTERSPLSYLTKPLAAYFNKAFRET